MQLIWMVWAYRPPKISTKLAAEKKGTMVWDVLLAIYLVWINLNLIFIAANKTLKNPYRPPCQTLVEAVVVALQGSSAHSVQLSLCIALNSRGKFGPWSLCSKLRMTKTVVPQLCDKHEDLAFIRESLSNQHETWHCEVCWCPGRRTKIKAFGFATPPNNLMSLKCHRRLLWCAKFVMWEMISDEKRGIK